jgi:hypothetical protein
VGSCAHLLDGWPFLSMGTAVRALDSLRCRSLIVQLWA